MKNFIVLFFVCLIAVPASYGQQRGAERYQYTFTLEEVLELAQDQSLESIRARNTFLSNYWQYRSFRASQLPLLNFSASLPDFSRQFISTQRDSGGHVITSYSLDYTNRISGRLALNQNLPTGGRVSLYTSLQQQQRFGESARNRPLEYMSTPISISFSQSIFGVNQWKWDRKIEPLRYEEAKRNYLKQTENIALNAIRYFFDLASAQQDLAIAEFNHSNNEELNKISQGRYNTGTIGENDLLQSELNFMNAKSTLSDATLNVETSQNRLRSFLGFNETVTVSIIIPEHVPRVELEVEHVMQWAKQNNPDLLAYQRQLIEAEKRVAEERAATGFQADLNFTFGLNQRSEDIANAYRNPSDMETARLTLSIPILDWGRGKGRVRMAKSSQQVVQSQVEQAYADFEQDIVLRVRQFNLQSSQFEIALKADTIAQRRYEASKQRYLIDRITITEMNNAQLDRDNSKKRYVTALRSYWNFYYQLRQIALFDFMANKPLEVEYESLR